MVIFWPLLFAGIVTSLLFLAKIDYVFARPSCHSYLVIFLWLNSDFCPARFARNQEMESGTGNYILCWVLALLTRLRYYLLRNYQRESLFIFVAGALAICGL